jgi:hypothetical protein
LKIKFRIENENRKLKLKKGDYYDTGN